MANEEVKWRYDVFLCFRGADTRLTFTGNLYHALLRNRFRTFMDHGGLKSGDQIANTILNAIQHSRIAIVVLSQNFASSSWCLDDLADVLQCRHSNNQLICPVFYQVDPSDVRHLNGHYGEAMARYENRVGNHEKLQIWKSALTQVASLDGFVFRHGYEYEFIERIVENAISI